MKYGFLSYTSPAVEKYQVPCYLPFKTHLDLTTIVLSTRVVKKNIRRDVEWMTLKAEFWHILSPIFCITDQSQATVVMKWGETILVIVSEYFHSPLRLITAFYRNVFYQTECNFILNISVERDTVVLSLSTAAIETEKSGTHGTNYHGFAFFFKLLTILFLEWDVWRDYLLIT